MNLDKLTNLTYENLLIKLSEKINIFEVDLLGITNNRSKGLYVKIIDVHIVFIDKSIDELNKKEILLEEWGHYKTSTGNILNQSKKEIMNRKQEQRALDCGIIELFPNEILKDAVEKTSAEKNDYEVAENLGISGQFLAKIIECKKRKGLIS